MESEIVNRILFETSPQQRISEITFSDSSPTKSDLRPDDITSFPSNDNSDQCKSYYTENINDTCTSEVWIITGQCVHSQKNDIKIESPSQKYLNQVGLMIDLYLHNKDYEFLENILGQLTCNESWGRDKQINMISKYMFILIQSYFKEIKNMSFDESTSKGQDLSDKTASVLVQSDQVKNRQKLPDIKNLTMTIDVSNDHKLDNFYTIHDAKQKVNRANLNITPSLMLKRCVYWIIRLKHCMENAELINDIKDIKLEMPFYDELYKQIDISKIDHIISMLLNNVPNYSKWASLKLLSLDIIDHLLSVPVLEVRKLIMLYNDGDFTLHYIEKKLEYEIRNSSNKNKDLDVETQEKLKINAFELLYVFEDFILTSYKRKFLHYSHMMESYGSKNENTLRRVNSGLISFSRNSNHSRELPKLTVNDIDDWQETSEDLLKLFALYFHKIDCLYDCFPSVYSKVYTIDSQELNQTLIDYLNKSKIPLRNGGLFRILINILIILIDGQNNQKHMFSLEKIRSKKSSKEIFTIFDKIIKDKSGKETVPKIRTWLISDKSFQPEEWTIDDFVSWVRQQAFRNNSEAPTNTTNLTPESVKRNRSHSQDSACMESKAQTVKNEQLYDIMNFILWKDQESYNNLINSVNENLELNIDLRQENVFWIDEALEKPCFGLSEQFKYIVQLENSENDHCVMKDTIYIVWHIINFLIRSLIKYNSTEKSYLIDKDPKFIKIKKDSVNIINQIRRIINSFEDKKDKDIYNMLFGQYFEQYLLKYFDHNARSSSFSNLGKPKKRKNPKILFRKFTRTLSIVSEESNPSSKNIPQNKYFNYLELIDFCGDTAVDLEQSKSYKHLSEIEIKEFKNLLELAPQKQIINAVKFSLFNILNDQIKAVYNNELKILIRNLKEKKDWKSNLQNKSSINKYQTEFNINQYTSKIISTCMYQSKAQMQIKNDYIWLNNSMIQEVKKEYNFVWQAYQQLTDKYVKAYDPFNNRDILLRSRRRNNTDNFSSTSLSDRGSVDFGVPKKKSL